MPFCTKCGASVGHDDRFCPNCGMPQHATPVAESSAVPPPPPPPPATPPTANATIRPNVAAMLCYIPGIGWIAALIFLTLDPYRLNQYVRFHAFQGLYLAVIALLTHVFWFPFGVAAPFHFFPLRHLIHLAVLIAQIIGIIKTIKEEPYRVPLVGDLAERSLA